MMRISIFFTAIIAFSFFLNGSGCTKIETPIRPEVGAVKDLTAVPEKHEILDTEPVRIEAYGGSGTITWCTDPAFENCFQPETGYLVVFTPPDLQADRVITIIASDENNSSVQIDISVIDEGPPPTPGDILINEIAWSGTLAGAYDEYVELINKTDRIFYLNSWKIENAAGTGKPFSFSGKIQPSSLFLIANYEQGIEKSSIISRVDYADSGLSLSNTAAGPFILINSKDVIFDTVGDGGEYGFGINSSDLKSSMSRYTSSTTADWNPDSWYTESLSTNLKDNTLGTPGAPNSDIPYTAHVSGDDAGAVITEYFIDVNEDLVEDWVELYITKSGNIRNFVVTDLDGDTDVSITNGENYHVNEGDYILVIWSTSYFQDVNSLYIPDVNPTGTKDELVLICGTTFLDGLCYYSTDEVQFDDEDKIRSVGWEGDPIHSKHASKKMDAHGNYVNKMEAASWNTDADPTQGKINN